MRRLGAFALLVILSGALIGGADAQVPRDEDLVTITGSQLSDLIGTPIADLALFRYDSPTNSFVPVPFQIDQKVVHTFSPGTPIEFTETIYDVLGEDDGLLDANDEVVFRFGDGAARAQVTTPWPAGADPQRLEASILDSRPGSGETRYTYLFAGAGLPHSPTQYVTWDGSEFSTISTDVMALDFTDKWLMPGIRIATPCGTNADMIDRAKGRAGAAPHLGESEQLWNGTSTYLGGILGPVRAIRYVRGAASAANTIHYDVVSRARWHLQINLRVHTVNQVWFYFDMRTSSGSTLFTPATPGGLPVDGTIDPSAPKPLQPWMLYRSSRGGVVTVPTIPPSPFYSVKESYILDNAAYNDAPIGGSYPDEDDSAIGNHGITLKSVTGNAVTDTIPLWFDLYPLCSNQGDATLGGAYGDMTTYPLVNSTLSQWTLGGPVRTVHIVRQDDDVVLNWEDLFGVTGYKVYVAPIPSLPHASWLPLGQTASTQFTDPDAAADAVSRYYSVLSVTPAGEGPW